jgi:sugar phosphate isomerase/epimerase
MSIMQRRTFLQTSSWLALAALSPAGYQAACRRSGSVDGIGIQLYTLRDLLQQDFEGTIRQVAAIGYQYIELFGYGNGQFLGLSPARLKKMLNTYDLQVVSGHVSTGASDKNLRGTMTNEWEMACEHAKEVGQSYIVLAWLAESERKTIDDYKRVAELLNRCAEVSRRYDLQMTYHNHDFEFIPIDGLIPYDVLLEQTDKELVKFELDQYWIRRTKATAAELYQRHPGRFPLWHVKDMAAGSDPFFAPVGDGIIDWPTVFREAEAAGMKHFFVEQDAFKEVGPMESITRSFRYLRAMTY